MKLILIILCFINFTHGYAASSDFLEIVPQAKYKAMAESVVGIVKGANALMINPAGLSEIQNSEIWLTHIEYIADFRYEYISYAQPFPFGTMGVNFSYFYVKPFDDIDLDGDKIGELKANNLMINLGYSRRIFTSLDSDLFWGAGIKFINSVLHTYTAWGFAFDFGLLFKTSFLRFAKTPLQNFSAGLAIQNIGTKLQYAHEKFSLPLKIRAGIGYHAYQYKEHGIIISIESDYFTDSSTVFVAGGLEYSYIHNLFIRCGYTLKKDTLNSYTFGLGGSYKFKGIDYFLDVAFAPYGVLKNIYIISLGAKF